MSLSRRQLLCLLGAFLVAAAAGLAIVRQGRSGGPPSYGDLPEPGPQGLGGSEEGPGQTQSPYFVRYADSCAPVRDEPKRFSRGSAMPAGGEGRNSTSIQYVSFDPARDLIEIYDDRVWWESDEDDATGDTEDDHLFHRAMEGPMCRLVEMVDRRGGVLKVQDSYRADGVHAARSLHKQGRAVDLTWMDPQTRENRSLGDLAKMCWAAGFDWVYFERSPPHIHASVRADPNDGD